jgi:hypothetical protein
MHYATNRPNKLIELQTDVCENCESILKLLQLKSCQEIFEGDCSALPQIFSLYLVFLGPFQSKRSWKYLLSTNIVFQIFVLSCHVGLTICI